jgi:integrase
MEQQKFSIESLINVPDFEIVNAKLSSDINWEKDVLPMYTKNQYYDNVWSIIDYAVDINIRLSHKKIYFGEFKSPLLMDMSRKYCLKRLMQHESISTINKKIASVRKIDGYFQDDDIFEINYNNIVLQKYYSLIFKGNKCTLHQYSRWTHVLEFFVVTEMNSWAANMRKFLIPYCDRNHRSSNKYIEEEDVKQLDVIFTKDLSIPIAYRLAYWIMRLLPNRITEVGSIKIDCLKKIDDVTYSLTIPTFKQSGPYNQPEIKMLFIKDIGFGKYFIDLIKEQREYSLSHPALNGESEYLLRTFKSVYCPTANKYYETEKYLNINIAMFNRKMQRISTMNNVKYITSHRLRHNAISDRANSGIFRLIDIEYLTGHHNSKMIEETYSHTTPQMLVEKVKNIRGEAPILFEGKIINSNDNARYAKILERPFSKKIHHLGICSDIRDCGKDKFHCIGCEFLIPDIDDLHYYQNEIADWQQKLETAEKCSNTYWADNCRNNILLYEALVLRVINAVSNFEKEAIQNEKSK